MRIMKKYQTMTALAVCFAAGSSLQAAVTFDLGNGEISASTVGLNDANAFATGAFTTAAVGEVPGLASISRSRPRMVDWLLKIPRSVLPGARLGLDLITATVLGPRRR